MKFYNFSADLCDGSYQNLHLNRKEDMSGNPVLGIGSEDRQDRKRYYIPMSAAAAVNKRSGKMIRKLSSKVQVKTKILI